MERFLRSTGWCWSIYGETPIGVLSVTDLVRSMAERGGS